LRTQARRSVGFAGEHPQRLVEQPRDRVHGGDILFVPGIVLFGGKAALLAADESTLDDAGHDARVLVDDQRLERVKAVEVGARHQCHAIFGEFELVGLCQLIKQPA
jgi:hypothetical protein